MKNIIRLFKYAKPWMMYIIIAVITMLVVIGVNLYSPYIVKLIIEIMETGQYKDSIDVITALALLQLGLFVIRAISRFFNNYFAHVASWNLVSRMRCKLYEHYQCLSMSYYQDKQTGQHMSRVVSDTATFENLIAHALPDLTSNLLTLIGVMIILFTIDAGLLLLICVPIPFILLLSVVLRKIRRNFRKSQAKIAELNAILQDNFSGIKEIQIFNRQEHEAVRFKEKSDDHANAIIKALFYSGILHPSVDFISSLGSIIVLIAGPIIALNNPGFSIAGFVAFMLYLNMVYAPISALSRIVEDIQMALTGAERVFEVLDTKPEIQDSPNAIDTGFLSGQLKFDSVNFAYGDGIPILHNISFEVKKGEMVAFVGPTGVGKTTISSLIARFYDPLSGVISMDGINTREMTLKSLRNQLSLVLQDVFLFNGSIAENISYGSENVSQSEIEEAAKAAYIHDYIVSLPEGYDTIIGERGVRLSGGQKQRISIARSILRNSPILILDEATSSVDVETETEIQNAINKIAGTRTLIIIAHRLSTIKRADKIIVLENGEIVKIGKYDEIYGE